MDKQDAEAVFTPLSGRYDAGSAHISIHAGAGGDDAKDWARMLFDMYVAYAKRQGWKVIQTDDNAIEVIGEFAYGRLHKESGVHRLVRLSPFNAKKLRHTSFALVEVVPVFSDVAHKKIVLPPEDLRIDFFRSSGPGGQNVNKRETAVRITHEPSGVAVAVQSERSQLQNKEKAMVLLKSRLLHMLELHQKEELKDLRSHSKPEWGSQIRSYVLHPYKMVKDHRTKIESHQPEKVLEGDLDKFIEAELNAWYN